MKKRFVWGSAVLVGLVLLVAAASATAGSFGFEEGCYKVGETILFKVEDQQRCFWGCCCSCCQPSCTATQVVGWRITDASGNIVYSVVHDVPVLASTWQGSWSGVDATGAIVVAGSYTLYVDTSVGTLSRCLRLYDPCGDCCCNRCWGWSGCGWSRCGCELQSTITSCGCRTTLVLVKQTTGCCRSLFWWPCCASCP